MTATPYEILGVETTATAAEIHKAFRKLSKKWHPDAGGDVAKFQEIEEAHRLLSDANDRAYYDANGEAPNRQHKTNPNAELYQMLDAIMQGAIRECPNPTTDNLIAAMHKEIARGRTEIAQGIEKRRKQIPALERYKKRIKSKGEENILASLLQSAIDALTASMETANHTLELMARADVSS